MRALLDVNVLVASLDPQNVFHAAAYEWMAVNFADGWASCPLTENACLRLMTNPRYRGGPVTSGTVLARLQATKRDSDHRFWPDDLSITDADVFDWNRLQGHQQVTDVYLLALAVAHGGRLVTFDQGIRLEAVQGSRPEHLVTL